MRSKYILLAVVALAGCIPAAGPIRERYDDLQSMRAQAEQAADHAAQIRWAREQQLTQAQAEMARAGAAMHEDFSQQAHSIMQDSFNTAAAIFGILFISGALYLIWRVWVGQQQRFLLEKIRAMDERTQVFRQTSAKIRQRYYGGYTRSTRRPPWHR